MGAWCQALNRFAVAIRRYHDHGVDGGHMWDCANGWAVSFGGFGTDTASALAASTFTGCGVATLRGRGRGGRRLQMLHRLRRDEARSRARTDGADQEHNGTQVGRRTDFGA